MKRIVIVGNGAKVLTSKNGKFIDSSDIVVRINNFKLKGYEDYVGTKTDIYSCTPKFIHSIDKTEDERVKGCIVRYEEELTIHPELESHKDLYVKVYTHPEINSDKMKEILLSYLSGNRIVKAELYQNDPFLFARLPFSSKLKICNFGSIFRHTTGYKTIVHCLKTYTDYEIFITGFDFFLESGWYWDLNPYWWSGQHMSVVGNPNIYHAFYLESERLKQMIQKNQVKEIL